MPAGSIFNLLPVRTPLELRDTAAPTVRRRRHRSRLSGNRFGGVAKSLAAAAGLDRASSDDAITRIADVSRQFFLGKGVPAEGLVIPAQSLRDLQQFSTLTIGQNWSAARVHPHGICVGIALRICGQQIVTDSGILTVRGKIAIPGRNPAGPYLFFGLCREVLGEWFITRAYAHPYVQGWLLVDSNSERSFYSELLSCLHNEGFTHVLIERPLFPDRDPVFFDFCLSIPGYPFRFWVEVLGTDFPGYVARKHQHARLLRSQGHLALMFPSYLPHRQRIQYFLQLRNELRQWVDRARRWRP